MLTAFVFVLRAPGFAHSVVVDWDEALYALMAREMLHGGLPYVTIFLEKPLGSTMLVAAAFAVLGESVWAVRMLGAVCVAGTVLVLRELALRGGLSRGAAAGAALLYGAYSTQLGGMASNIEIMFAPFTAGAVLVALRHQDCAHWPAQWRAILLAGLLIGVGIWCKYIAAFPGFVLFAVLVGWWWVRGWLTCKQAGLLGAIYFLACLSPTLATAGYYAWIGHWADFWYCNIGFMPIYRELPRAAADIATTLAIVLITLYAVLAAALIGLICWRERPGLMTILAFWLLAEAVALVVPGKYWDHYFLLLLPPLSLMAGAGMDGAFRRFVPRVAYARLAGVPVAACIMLVLGGSLLALPDLRQRWDKPDPSARIAAFLRQDPAATLWVINHEPMIYFLAGLPLPTVYVFPPHLTGAYSIVARVDPEQEVRRILVARPRYLVLDPADQHMILPHLRSLIMATIMADYEQVFEAPGRAGPIPLYRLRNRLPSDRQG